MITSESAVFDASLQFSTVRPFGVYALSGLASDGSHLLGLDRIRGYLVRINPHTNNTEILNPHSVGDWVEASGLAVWDNQIWFAKGQEVFWCDRQTLTPNLFARLPHPVSGVAVWDSIVYVACPQAGHIYGFDREKAQLTVRLPQVGVGFKSMAATETELWVCDHTEQTVFCLDRTTGQVRFKTLTPFASPTGIAFYRPTAAAEPLCYIAYALEEPYIRDDPNADSPYQLTFRDRTFIHPLHWYQDPTAHYTLSNGYLVELSYVEELLPLEAVTLNNVEWRIALPSNTQRQRVRSIEPIGHPFTIEEQEGEQVAVFRFDQLQPHQGGLLGWRAQVEMYGLKYQLTPEDIPSGVSLPSDWQQRYLADNDELAMDQSIVRRAAQAAVGTETNVLRKMLRIRNYVYDRLSYGIRPKIDTPDLVLERGIGSCGEYVGVLLAIARLNGIACRTIGRYKCPPHPDWKSLPLEPDFNHVWLEFYVPGIGWLPMESNVDDVIERGPYPERFFMGLAWYHAELGKGIKFEKMTADNLPEHISVGDLAINHIRFTIVEELKPKLIE
ncbi:MAG TPA: transglutaminase family protein [Stenomitos sp.]